MRLHKNEVKALCTLLDTAAAAITDVQVDPARKSWKEWDRLYTAFSDIPANVDMPLGELLNPDLGLLPVIWDKQGRLKIHSFKELSELQANFGTSAIEGAFCVQMDLVEALKLVDLVSSPYRFSISVPRHRIRGYLRQSLPTTREDRLDASIERDPL